MRALPFVLSTSLLTLVASSAAAAEFTADGTLAFSASAAFTESFEQLGARPGFEVRETNEALEGKKVGYVLAQSFDQTFSFPITLPAKDAAYQARMFVRKNRVLADIDVEGNALAEVSARFYPTGRVTSDGWYEVQTAPFSVEGSRSAHATVSIFASGAEIDGFEVTEVGPARTLRACSGKDDPICGPDEFCAARVCHDGSLGLPPLPAPEFRESIVQYLRARVSLFFGGRFTRNIFLPAALGTIDRMNDAQNAWQFWNAFATAIRQLRDWHTRMDAAVTVSGRGALPVCFVEGDADLSRGAAPSVSEYADVLVSHVGPTQNFGLKPGDRLVAVNGKHPIEFMESLETVNWDTWRANDPQTQAEKLENLRKAIRRWAKDITLVRCDPTTNTCAPPETVPVSALSDVEPEIYPECDHRPAYHLSENGPDPVQHSVDGVHYGKLAGTTDSEALYGMVWNDVYLDGQSSNPYAAAMDAFRTKANGVVLDHRTGNGGTELAAEYLTELFRAPAKLGASTGFNFTIDLLGPQTTLNDALAIFDRRKNTDDAFNVGSASARTNLRAALLIARDGSASDWFPLGMRGAPNVRLFGRRTAGAFSSYLSFDYYGQMSFRLASGDFVASDGATRIGYGVQPDEDLLPKQSDLLKGRDTVYERALAWVRTGK